MGGILGRVEGHKKLAAWIKFKRLKSHWRFHDADEEIYTPGMYLIFPRSKKEAFQSMYRNEDDSAWVLRYHFHS